MLRLSTMAPSHCAYTLLGGGVVALSQKMLRQGKGEFTRYSQVLNALFQWRKSACGPKFESLIHIIGHDKTSDTVEDNLY